MKKCLKSGQSSELCLFQNDYYLYDVKTNAAKILNGMAKIAIKCDNIVPYGGIF